ncbi:MAG: rhamnulokinase [Deinococcota bacterium]|nr:rhamnulokinase [Deinococcota bacterium]
MGAEASRHVAVDLGASSGRVALGVLEGGRLEVTVLHRFHNEPASLRGHLYWDVLGLWREVLRGLKLAAAAGPVASVGVDSWAVDYVLLDEDGLLMDGAHHYRDARTDGVMEDAFKTLSRSELYERTGLQFLPFNTLYQLLAVKRDLPGLLARAARLVMIPDLFHYWLGGRIVGERTNASTTQLFDPRTAAWSPEVLAAFGLPPQLLPELVEPGTVLGTLTNEVARDTGLAGTALIAPATHDTASAVAAVPAEGEGWAFVSSGTWSLVGVETGAPVLTAAALGANLSNEAGVRGSTRLLKNVMGLWILQECRAAWGEPGFESLLGEAEAHGPLGLLIDPDDARLLPPGPDMPERVCRLVAERHGRTLTSRATVTRCVLESLAARYAEVLNGLERVTGLRVRTVHVVGGGAQIDLLNQLSADASGREVLAGPAEATLMGNLLVQAEALGTIPAGSLREVVRRSTTTRRFTPSTGGAPRHA